MRFAFAFPSFSFLPEACEHKPISGSPALCMRPTTILNVHTLHFNFELFYHFIFSNISSWWTWSGFIIFKPMSLKTRRPLLWLVWNILWWNISNQDKVLFLTKDPFGYNLFDWKGYKGLKEDFLIFSGQWHDGLPCPVKEGEPGGDLTYLIFTFDPPSPRIPIVFGWY